MSDPPTERIEEPSPMLGVFSLFMNNAISFERGLAIYSDLVREEPELSSELEASRIDFGPAPADPSERELYDRRHLEWFLFDRPCERLQGAPVEALYGRWQERVLAEAPDAHDLGSSFLQSIAGVFEVTTSRPGAGMIVNDLLGLGTYEVEEREASGDIEAGDLIVGRLHPMGDVMYHFSPAAGAFRNPELLEALRGDLGRMREARRGVLRIQQNELEKLFFSSESNFTATPSTPSAATYEEGQQRALETMRSAGIAPDTCGEVLNAVGDSIQVGDPTLINDILDQLAFDTEVDLEELRRAFAEMSDAFQRRQHGAAKSTQATSGSARSVQDALQDFDRGRAEGGDLEQLFRTLEKDLGVEEGDDENGLLDGAAATFPGVVGAIVEEFLWDIGREQGEQAAKQMEPLRLFVRYAEKIDIFEDLGPKELLDFCARWLLDEAEVDAVQANAVLQALDAFCKWCEEQHSHPLHTEFARTLNSLKDSVPRLLELRALTTKEPLAPGAYRVCDVEGERALVERVMLQQEDDAERVDVVLDPTQAKRLCKDDLVCLTEAEPRRIGRLYPAELEGVLRALI